MVAFDFRVVRNIHDDFRPRFLLYTEEISGKNGSLDLDTRRWQSALVLAAKARPMTMQTSFFWISKFHLHLAPKFKRLTTRNNPPFGSD